jgi:ankyrin repeat protein
MSDAAPIPYGASLEEYERQATALFAALMAGDDSAKWRFKWEHPRFRGTSVAEVAATPLSLGDAQEVIAREHGFATWANVTQFTDVIRRDGGVQQFEAAVDAVIEGDLAALNELLRANPALVRARSTRRHRATLLHYVAANGVENARQKTPANAVEVARMLLGSGAEVDALADMYDAKCTTMSMLVSSCHPAEMGLQAALAETLLDYGAALDDGPGSPWQSPLMTALTFGYLATAETLARRGARLDNFAAAAGLGRIEDATRLLATADAESKHIGLALAAQHGHAAVVRLLLDAGEDPNRYNPEGFHAHATPLHHAALAGHTDVVRLLVERGARSDIRDKIHESTPLDWAIHGGQTATAAYLRDRGQAR